MFLENFKRRVFETHGAFYVLEGLDNSKLIVDKKFLELFLCKMYFQAIIDCNLSSYKGFHLGNDHKIYERRVLNCAGLATYYKLHIRRLNHKNKTLQAVKEMANNKNVEHLKDEKERIKYLLRYSGFKRVYKYTGSENKKPQLETTENNQRELER